MKGQGRLAWDGQNWDGFDYWWFWEPFATSGKLRNPHFPHREDRKIFAHVPTKKILGFVCRRFILLENLSNTKTRQQKESASVPHYPRSFNRFVATIDAWKGNSYRSYYYGDMKWLNLEPQRPTIQWGKRNTFLGPLNFPRTKGNEVPRKRTRGQEKVGLFSTENNRWVLFSLCQPMARQATDLWTALSIAPHCFLTFSGIILGNRVLTWKWRNRIKLKANVANNEWSLNFNVSRTLAVYNEDQTRPVISKKSSKSSKMVKGNGSPIWLKSRLRCR